MNWIGWVQFTLTFMALSCMQISYLTFSRKESTVPFVCVVEILLQFPQFEHLEIFRFLAIQYPCMLLRHKSTSHQFWSFVFHSQHHRYLPHFAVPSQEANFTYWPTCCAIDYHWQDLRGFQSHVELQPSKN